MKNKKYYTIGEVKELLNITATRLRYLEKTILNFVLSKVKGRRYYTLENIEVLKSKIFASSKPLNHFNSPLILDDQLIVDKINNLINSLDKLSLKIKEKFNI